MRTKFLFSILIVTIVALAAIAIFYWWFLARRDRIATGTAMPYFPYTDYSIDELNKMYPQTMNENVATTQSPEETHAKFISGLKQGNFDEAVRCCFLEKDWEDMKEALNEVQQDGQLNLMVSDLNEIRKEMLLDTMATYSYTGTSGGEKVGALMEFVKDHKGVWRIVSF